MTSRTRNLAMPESASKPRPMTRRNHCFVRNRPVARMAFPLFTEQDIEINESCPDSGKEGRSRAVISDCPIRCQAARWRLHGGGLWTQLPPPKLPSLRDQRKSPDLDHQGAIPYHRYPRLKDIALARKFHSEMCLDSLPWID